MVNICISVQELYDGGYLTTKDIKLSNDEAIKQYVLVSYNDTIKQYGFAFVKEDWQKTACNEYLEGLNS
jgi:hypothetical protein